MRLQPKAATELKLPLDAATKQKLERDKRAKIMKSGTCRGMTFVPRAGKFVPRPEQILR